MGYHRFPEGLSTPPMTASERWQRDERAQQAFDQLRSAWIERRQAEEARYQEIMHQRQAERSAEAEALADHAINAED